MTRVLQVLAVLLLVTALALGLRSGFGTLLGEPSLEQQTRTLAQQLRCPVCTGQSVAESDSTVANQMRDEIREKLRQGETPADILASFEARYGAWIINKPPGVGWYRLIWAGPFLAAAGGVWALSRYVARQRRWHPETAPELVRTPDDRDKSGSTEAEVAARLKDYL